MSEVLYASRESLSASLDWCTAPSECAPTVGGPKQKQLPGLSGLEPAEQPVWRVPGEASALAAIAWIVRAWDPDIMTGWELERGSWGILLERSSYLGIPLHLYLARCPPVPRAVRSVDQGNSGSTEGQENYLEYPARMNSMTSDTVASGAGAKLLGPVPVFLRRHTHPSSVYGVGPAIYTRPFGKLPRESMGCRPRALGIGGDDVFSRRWLGGRLVLNGWRIARGEVKLSRFMLEDCVRAVLGVSLPRPSNRAVTEMLLGNEGKVAPSG